MFDIDGVLYKVHKGGSKKMIPGADEALNELRKRDIPFILGIHCYATLYLYIHTLIFSHICV